jgi:hypothetical protein
MTRTFITMLALVFVASMSARAAEPLSAEAKAGIAKALAEIGCTPSDNTGVEGNGTGYYNDGATCKDGTYDFGLDSGFKIIDKRKK